MTPVSRLGRSPVPPTRFFAPNLSTFQAGRSVVAFAYLLPRSLICVSKTPRAESLLGKGACSIFLGGQYALTRPQWAKDGRMAVYRTLHRAILTSINRGAWQW